MAGSSPSSAAARAPGSLASGRYQVVRFLGEGAKKRVYLARDTRLNRDVAVATIKTEGLDEGGLVRVRREAEAMGQLGDHRNVVTVFDVIEENGQIAIVSQYMAGGDVEGQLREAEERRFPIEEAIRIASEVCSALEHAHSRGVIHRDVKPGNVWLGEDGTAMLGDFGLAISIDRSRITQEGMMVGTVSYMAPEQALGRQPEARTDLYSLGATLYEMVAGRPPFVGDDGVAVISQHLNTPPVAPSWHNADVPRALETVILRLLAKDPNERFETAKAVREVLESAARPPTSSEESAAPEPTNPLDRLARGVFVGRDDELTTLRKGVDDALSGRGRVLMLVGEPGIGKTRTAEEFTTYARMRGAQVLWGRCYEGEGAPAYWPWVQAIRSFVHEREPKQLMSEMGPGAADIAEVVSEVRERLPGLPAPPKLEPEQARFRLFDSIATFLRNAAGQQPLMLVLDDLHWADKPSLLLLQFLAREVGSTRLLVLGTYRDVELSRRHPLSETLAELARNQLSERIDLRGLTEADVARFIQATASVEPPSALVAAVYRETEGNPFFIHEVVRLLVKEGRLERPEAETEWSLSIPQGVREVIGRRLNTLSEECNRALTVASVVGREFEVDVLARLCDLDEDRLLQALEEAVAARLLEEAPSPVGRYIFSHALVQETLYEELTTPRRVRLHHRVGEVLEAHYAGKLDSHLSELAHHFFQSVQGGDVDKAIAYATRAAERAADLVAYEEAAAHYDRALQVLDLQDAPHDRSRRFELLLSLSDVEEKAGEAERAKSTAGRALEVARELAEPEAFARAAVRLVDVVWQVLASNADSIGLLEDALTRLPAEDSVARAQTLARLARELIWSGTPERGRALLEDAAAMAERLGDPATQAFLLQVRWVLMWRPENVRERIEITRDMSRFASETGDKALANQAHALRGLALLEQGSVEEADRNFAASARLAEELRQPVYLWQAAVIRANRTLMGGDFEETERLAREALELGQHLRIDFALQSYAIQLSRMRSDQGRVGELEGLYRNLMENLPNIPTYRARVASICAELGKEEEAREHYEILGQNDFADFPRDGAWLIGISQIAQVCHQLRDTRRASILYDLMLPSAPYAVTVGPAACSGAAARWLGLLAWTLSRWEDAERHFQDAIDLNTRLASPPLVARAQLDYAEMLLDRNDPGDREKALELLNESLDTARQLGMKMVLEKALALKLETQGADRSDTKHSIYAIAASVGDERPNLGAHAAADGSVTLMFSDMEGFTAMTERLGDTRAHAIVQDHHAIVRKQTAAHDGHEVELRGDGFLLAFSEPLQAVRCAGALHRAFADYSAKHPEEPVRVRIGLHTGEAIKDADKFFGKTVIRAFRIADLAKGAQTLVSAEVKALLEGADDLRFDEGRKVELKGISGGHRVYAVE